MFRTVVIATVAAIAGGAIALTSSADGVIPMCAVEDCSDQPGQIGVWESPRDGRYWLSVGEVSVPVAR